MTEPATAEEEKAAGERMLSSRDTPEALIRRAIRNIRRSYTAVFADRVIPDLERALQQIEKRN